MKIKYSKKLMEYNRIDNQTDRIYNTYLASAGISEKTMWILYSAYTSDGATTQAEICENWCCVPQTIHSALKVLEKKEIVQLSFIEGNRKSKHISLTDKGIQMCRQIVEPLVCAENAAFARLTEDEQKQLIALTRKYSNALKKETAALSVGSGL